MKEAEPMESVTARLDALFAPWNRSDSPGLAVGIQLDSRVIYRRGYGMASLESALPMTPHTKLRIGSTSKHFTALLALLLSEEGKLDLDAPIRTSLPELDGPGGEPTTRQLLQHRGGSRCYLDLGFIAHGMATPPPGRALAIQALQTGRNFQAGTATIYNNGGYHLVSLAIGRITGADFADVLKQRLLDPLGLSDTLLLASDHRILPGMATLHVPLPDGGWRRGLFPSEEVLGEGGIVSTIDDMLRWTRHLRSRKRFGRPESWKTLIEQPVFEDGSVGPYALGLIVGHYRGLKTVHHAGGVIGGLSQMLTFPDDGLDVVILANGAAGADPTALAELVADIVLEDRLGPLPEDLSAEVHDTVLGHWWSPDTQMIYTLGDDKGLLKLGFCGSPLQPVRPSLPGQGLVSVGSLGDILVDLAPGADGRLAIRFGGRIDHYVRLESAAGDSDAFLQRAAGRYLSSDADCTVWIGLEKARETIVFSDGFGVSELAIDALSPAVAIARRSVGQLPFTIALSLQQDGGLIASTGRTRFLRFERIEKSDS